MEYSFTMKKLIILLSLVCAMTLTAFAQNKMAGMDGMDEAKPTEIDKTAAIPTKGFLKRGAPLANAKKVSLAKIMANPADYAGKTVRVDGVIAGIEGFDNARPDRATSPITAGNDVDPVVLPGVFGQDLRRCIGRAVVDNDPFGRPHRLRQHRIKRLPHVIRFIAARGNQNVALVHAIGGVVKTTVSSIRTR